MSKNKAMNVDGYVVWACDDAHDLAIALVAEACDGDTRVKPEWLHQLRVAACVHPYAADFAPQSNGERGLMLDLVATARARAVEHGDFHRPDVASWFLLEATPVAYGSLRSEVVQVSAVIEVLDGIRDALCGTPDVPPGDGWWMLGLPGGRRIFRPGIGTSDPATS